VVAEVKVLSYSRRGKIMMALRPPERGNRSHRRHHSSLAFGGGISIKIYINTIIIITISISGIHITPS
jgi:hypothetical protein